MPKTKFTTIDDYIAAFPAPVQQKLEKIRLTIREAAPEAEETISYQMPAFKLNGILVYFAAFKNHIGFYPTPSGIVAFSEELAPYKPAKGSVKFPIDKPIPLDLIQRIIRYKVMETQKSKINPRRPEPEFRLNYRH